MTNANPTTYLAGKAVVSGLFLMFGFVLLLTGNPPQTVLLIVLGGVAALVRAARLLPVA